LERMLCAAMSRLAQVRVTLAYAVIVTGVTLALVELGPQVQDRVIRHVSTNLHNLSHGHIGTLLGSAFVIDAGPIYLWLPGLVCLLAAAELTWGSGRLIVAFAVGHIGATVLVAIGLTAAVGWAWLPGSVARATDVGMSYGASAVLGSLTPAISRRFLPAWIGCWLAVAVAVIVVGRDFTDVGHAVALGLGMALSTRFGQPQRWAPWCFLLFAVGASFGYLVVASTSLVIVTASALLGAFVFETVARWRMASQKPDMAEVQLQPQDGIAAVGMSVPRR
jgi:hypothetical protein